MLKQDLFCPRWSAAVLIKIGVEEGERDRERERERERERTASKGQKGVLAW